MRRPKRKKIVAMKKSKQAEIRKRKKEFRRKLLKKKFERPLTGAEKAICEKVRLRFILGRQYRKEELWK